MITVNEATQKALELLMAFYPKAELPQLEEVELSENEQYWYITLSFGLEEPGIITSPFIGLKPRKYKTFKITSESGAFVSMKIRDLK